VAEGAVREGLVGDLAGGGTRVRLRQTPDLPLVNERYGDTELQVGEVDGIDLAALKRAPRRQGGHGLRRQEGAQSK